MRAAGFEPLHEREHARFELQHGQRGARLEQGGRHQGHRQGRHHRAHFRHQDIGETLDLGETGRLIEHAEVDTALLDVLPQRQRRAEAHASIAETIPAAAQPQRDMGEQRLEQDNQVEPVARAAALLDGKRSELQAVLQHAVVIDADRHEYRVARSLRIEARHHVADQAELRGLQFAVARQPALREHRLCQSAGDRHVDVARQYLAIERIARIAAHEIGAHGTDQALQQPHPRPFADRVTERRTCRRHVGDQHVVHIGAVVDDEDNGAVGINGLERVFIHVTEPDPVKQRRKPARQARPDPEIGIGRKRRHDLACIVARQLLRGRAGDAVVPGVILDFPEHVGIEHELVDQRLPFGELERLDAQFEPGVEFVDRPVEPPSHHPACARQQQVIERGHDR